MKLSHFSKVPVTFALQDVPAQPTHDAVKPKGFWVSVDGAYDWEAWSKAEQFRLESVKFRQEITLASNVLNPIGGDDRGVLHLTSAACLDDFTDRYAKIEDRLKSKQLLWIDWVKVAEAYDGILISPYIWERRMDLIWYYGWDCASGCIWRPSKAIAHVGPPQPVDWLADVTREGNDDDDAG